MKKPMSTTSLFDILSEVRGTKLTKVAQIDRVIDWAPVGAVIETVYTQGSAPTGRPSYDGLMLFKTELLRVWYGLCDEGVEEMLNDRISFSRFVGLSLAAPAPDSTTVLQFRRAMAEAGALDQVLREINRQLEAQGLVVKRGAIIDAGATAVSASTRRAASSSVSRPNRLKSIPVPPTFFAPLPFPFPQQFRKNLPHRHSASCGMHRNLGARGAE